MSTRKLFELSQTYEPLLPRYDKAIARRGVIDRVASGFAFVFSRQVTEKSPSELRKEIDSFSNALERTLHKFDHLDPDAKRQLDVLAMAALGENYSIEEAMSQLKTAAFLLPALADTYQRMDMNARGRGGPKVDMRFRLIAMHLVEAWKLGVGEYPKLWRDRADEPAGQFWAFAVHACQHFLPGQHVPKGTLYEACYTYMRT